MSIEYGVALVNYLSSEEVFNYYRSNLPKENLTSYANRQSIKKIFQEEPNIKQQLLNDIKMMTKECSNSQIQEFKNYFANYGINIFQVRYFDFEQILYFWLRENKELFLTYKNLLENEDDLKSKIHTFCQSSAETVELQETLEQMILSDIKKSKAKRECAVLLLAFQETSKNDIASYLSASSEEKRKSSVFFTDGNASQTDGRNIYLSKGDTSCYFPIDSENTNNKIFWGKLCKSLVIWHEFNHIKNTPVDVLVAGSGLFEDLDKFEGEDSEWLFKITNVGGYEHKTLGSIFDYRQTNKGKSVFDELGIDPSLVVNKGMTYQKRATNRQNSLNYRDISAILGVSMVPNGENNGEVILIIDPYSEMALALGNQEIFRLSHTGVVLNQTDEKNIATKVKEFRNEFTISTNKQFLQLFAECLGIPFQENEMSSSTPKDDIRIITIE